jgi:nitroreductase
MIAFWRADMKEQARLPNSAHASRPWRIHEITADFRLEDVWALPAGGEESEFPALVQGFAAGDPSRGSWLARALWSIRWKLGELLGWDEAEAGLGERVPTLRGRLPADLLAAPGPHFDTLPFTSLYLIEHEFAAEIANSTMHGVMHLSWVAEETGAYRGQMAVLVKPNGLFGTVYMAAIRPFRYLIVYPAMMRQIEREVTRSGRTVPPRTGG